jgi:sugar/nucleoside kinase (ribokinase family)
MALIRTLIPKADYYFPSTDEFLALWGAPNIEAGLLGRDWGRAQVALKDGAQGAWVVIDGAAVRVPSYPVIPQNTVGAGDAFNAGVIAAVQSGIDFAEAVRYGCATAALKISRSTLPSFAEVEEMITA